MRHPRLALASVVLVALALHAPSLSWGFFADDHGHQMVLEGRVESATWKPWSLYDFGGFAQASASAAQSGGFPWWTDAEFTLRFFRPLTSLSIWLDHALYGRWAVGYHFMSLALFALLLVLLHVLYRALELPPPAALLAVLLFAVEYGSLVPAGWIANRNTLLEVLFTVGAVCTVASPRVKLGAASIALALLLALCACLSKESGAAAPVLLALCLWRLRSQHWARIGIAAALALAGAYFVFLLGAGYGSHSEFYPTPWGAPVSYLGRLPALVALAPIGMAAPFPLDGLFFEPALFWPGLIVGALLSLGVCWLIWPRARKHPSAEFLAGWVFISLLPQAGAPPSSRLLFGPMVGGSALLALFLCENLPREARDRSSFRMRAAALLVAASALPLSAAGLVMGGLELRQASRAIRQALLEADVGGKDLGRREVFILQSSPTALVTLAPLSQWVFETGDREVRFWPMQVSVRALRWTRVDETSFDLESLDEPFLTAPFEAVFLAHPPRPVVGTRWSTALFTVEAIESDANGLRAIRVRCPASLDSPSYRFLLWRDGRLRHMPPPAVGESIELARGYKLALQP